MPRKQIAKQNIKKPVIICNALGIQFVLCFSPQFIYFFNFFVIEFYFFLFFRPICCFCCTFCYISVFLDLFRFIRVLKWRSISDEKIWEAQWFVLKFVKGFLRTPKTVCLLLSAPTVFWIFGSIFSATIAICCSLQQKICYYSVTKKLRNLLET